MRISFIPVQIFAQLENLLFTAIQPLSQQQVLLLIFIKTSLVVVMMAVELWKALQPLSTQWSSAIVSRWRIVGNGEYAAWDQRIE